MFAISTFSNVAVGTVECYDVQANRWQIGPALPKKLRSVAATKLGSSIYLCGGIDLENLARTDEMFALEVENSAHASLTTDEPQWVLQESRMLHTRFRHAAVTINGKILIAGGIIKPVGSQEESFTATTEVFDLLSNTWTVGPTMCKQRAIDIHLIVVKSGNDASNGVVYAIGGDVQMPAYDGTCIGENDYPIGSIEKLVIGADGLPSHWEFVSYFPHERRGVTSAAVGTKIYIFGGRRGDSVSAFLLFSA